MIRMSRFSKQMLSLALGVAFCGVQAQQRYEQQSSDASASRQRQESATSARSPQQQGQQRLFIISTGQIAESPAQFYGKKVQVSAPITEVYGQTVFTLDEDQLFAGPDVLVVVPGGTIAPTEGQEATVTGTVREFVSADIRSDYDWYGYGWYGYDWNDYNDVWVTWQSRPVIIADSVLTEAGRELVQGRGESGQAARRIYSASPGAIAQQPEAYYGHHVRSRAEVEEVFGRHAFTLDEDRLLAGPDVLVFVPQPAGRAKEDTVVTVIGQVRPFTIAEFERDYGWFDREMFTDQDVLQQWDQDRRPVIVATSVRTPTGAELVRSGMQQEAVGSPGSLEGMQREEGGASQGRSSRQDRTSRTGASQQYGQTDESRTTQRGQSAGAKVQDVIADWQATPKKAAQAMLEKYGPPQEITQQRLIWHNNGPWKRTVVINEQIPHNFPMPHYDVLEQVVNYKIPADKFDELAQFDGSVIAERTRGELSARCDKEAANLLAVNLAHEIVTGKKSVDEARNAYAEAIKSLMQGEQSAYTQKLQFATPTTRAGDPGKAVIEKQRSGQGTTGAQGDTQRGQGVGGASGSRTITITANNMEFRPSRIEAAPGERLVVVVTNASETAKHSIEFHLPSGEAELSSPVTPGGQAMLGIKAPTEAGSYVFYCPVGNHREQGMEGRLIVRDAVASEPQGDSSNQR